MSPVRSEPEKPKVETQLKKPPTFFVSIPEIKDQSTALEVINHLLANPRKDLILPALDKEPIDPQLAAETLVAYLKSPLFEEVKPFLPETHRKKIPDLRPDFLNLLALSIGDFLKQKEEEKTTPQSQVPTGKIKEWQKELENAEKLEEFDQELTQLAKTNLLTLTTLNQLDLETQIQLIKNYQENLKQLTSQRPGAKEWQLTIQAFRTAVSKTSAESTNQQNQEYQKKVVSRFEAEFAAKVKDWGIKDKELEAQVGQKVAGEHGPACAQKATELYAQYLQAGWEEKEAAIAAAKESLQATMAESIYVGAALAPSIRKKRKLEESLAQVLQSNGELITQTQVSLKKNFRDLQIANSPTYQQMVDMFKTELGQGLLNLGFSPTDIESLKTDIQQEAVRGISVLEKPFVEPEFDSPDQAAFQTLIQKEVVKSLNSFFTKKEQRKKQNDILLQGELGATNLGQITYDYARFRPSAKDSLQEPGRLNTFQALVYTLRKEPSFAFKFMLSKLTRDNKLDQWRLLEIAQKFSYSYSSLYLAKIGFTPQSIQNMIAGLRQGKVLFNVWQIKKGVSDQDPRIAKLRQLALELAAVQEIINNPKGSSQRLFSLQARMNQSRYQIFETDNQINPLRPFLYPFDLLQKETLGRFKGIIKPVKGIQNYLRNKVVLGRFFSPGYRMGLAWHNLLRSKFIKKSFWFNRTLKTLPKLKPSYWLRPVYWSKKGIKKAVRWGAKKLGRLLLKVGGKLATKLGKKLLAWATEAALGITGGPVGIAVFVGGLLVNIGVFAVKAAKYLLFTPEGKMLLKKATRTARNILGAGLIVLYKLIKLFPWSFLGLGIGSLFAPFIGPLPIVIGGSIGFFIDTVVAPWLTKAFGSSLGIFGSAGAGFGLGTAGGTAAAAEAATGSFFLAPTTAATIVPGAALILGTLGAYSIVTNNSTFLPPERLGEQEEATPPWESESVSLKKTADKTVFTNEELASNPQATYTITITPKEGEITIKQVEDEVEVFSRTTPAPPAPTASFIPPLGQTTSDILTFTYILPLNSGLADSRIENTITVIIINAEGGEETVSAYADITLGNPPAIDCPIALEYSPYINECSYGSSLAGCDVAGYHGSNRYWGGSCGGYRIPVFNDCWGPMGPTDPDGTTNVCWEAHHEQNELCPDYGKAMDVAPASGGGTEVLLPSIDGETVVWTYERNSSSNWGWGQLFNTTHNGHNYHLIIYHVNETSPGCSQCSSGTRIGTVYGAMTRPHVHIELQIDGSYVMPENHMCRGLPVHN